MVKVIGTENANVVFANIFKPIPKLFLAYSAHIVDYISSAETHKVSIFAYVIANRFFA